MIPAENPNQLWRLASRLESDGAAGFLLSGGCDRQGRVPLEGFGGVLRRIKRETGLMINVHPGLVGKEEADMLSSAQVDTVSVDVAGSERTLREVYNLNVGIRDVERSLRFLRESSLPLTPHICVGVHGGRLLGESRALDIVSRYDPKALVLTALLPVPGTPFEPVRVEGSLVVEFFRESRRALPNIPIVLGCMRPRDDRQLDQALLAEGIDGIAVPLPTTIRTSGVKEIKSTCCSLIGSKTL